MVAPIVAAAARTGASQAAKTGASKAGKTAATNRTAFYQKRLEALKSAARAEGQEETVEGEETESMGALDPGFVLMSFFAIFVDVLDIFKDGLAELLGISEIVGIILDAITYLIIAGWIYARTKKVINSKKQQAEQLGKQAKSFGNIFKKAFGKRGLIFILEAIPIVGLIPFWTITVFDVLKEKGE